MEAPITPTPQRDPATIGRISLNPGILCGKPAIAGTRISVELILEELAGGLSFEEILDAYTHLDRRDIQAALRFALGSIRHEEITLQPGAAS